MLEVLESEFVVTLRAAGIPSRVILFKHVLRNSALPTLMLLGVNVSYLIGGNARCGAGFRHQGHRQPAVHLHLE
ncbi:ABC transporter permease subunit [Paenibacillus rhizoplanae]